MVPIPNKEAKTYSSPVGPGSVFSSGVTAVVDAVGETEGVLVGFTFEIIFKGPTVNGPSVPLSVAAFSLSSPALVVTGVVKYNTKETMTLPFLSTKSKKAD